MFPDAMQDCCHCYQDLACHCNAVVTGETAENNQTSFPSQVKVHNKKPPGDSFWSGRCVLPLYDIFKKQSLFSAHSSFLSIGL